jgi:hypothetical protein
MPSKPTRKTHPELFKSLSRVLGARQAVKQMATLDESVVGAHGWLVGCFTWFDTKQGHDYWSKLHFRLVRIDPSYKQPY